MAATFVATVGDVDFRLDCARGDIHEFADSCRYLPVLGFAGGGDRRVRDGEKWGENLTSLRAETTFLILDFRFMSSFSIFNSQFSIVNHRLVDGEVVHLVCSKNTRPLKNPDTIVLHYTAGRSAESSSFYLTRPDVGASAHVVIGRDGKVFQLVSFNVEAWHAGRSFYRGRAEFNHFSIGIELDNLGKLRWDGKRFVAECGAEVAASDVYADDSGGNISYWHKYTDRQIRVLRDVCRVLVSEYPIRHILRHSDITPRKIDPGPALPEITLY